jgi:HSP20 family molecular chaperone IbpA
MSMPSPSIRVTVGKQTQPTTTPEAIHEPAAERRPMFAPPIDIHENAEGLILEADLPGATESNLFIQLEDNVLSLHAKVEAPPAEERRPLHEEYLVGDFYRSFILSDEVDRDRISAEMKNGVLRLTLPKADRARSRRIEIRS